MLAELRAKSQITLPKELVEKLSLCEGDKLEIFEKNGTICMMPVAVYPKGLIDELKTEIETAKAMIATGDIPIFDSIESLLADLDSDQ